MPEKLKRGDRIPIAPWKIALLFLAGATTGTCAGVTFYGTYKVIQEARAAESLIPEDGIFIFGSPPTPESSPTQESAFTQTPDYRGYDNQNEDTIARLDDGEQGLFGYMGIRKVMQINIPLAGDAYFAMGGTEDSNQVVFWNAKCLHDYLESANQLGEMQRRNEAGTVWAPSLRFPLVSGTVTLQQFGDDLPPLLRMDGFSVDGVTTVECPQALDIPGIEDIMRFAGGKIRGALEGLEEGLSGN